MANLILPLVRVVASMTPFQPSWSDPESVGTTENISAVRQEHQYAIVRAEGEMAVCFVPDWQGQEVANEIARRINVNPTLEARVTLLESALREAAPESPYLPENES